MADTLPTIHLNGSSKRSLVRDAQSAYSALIAAVDALCAMHPHQRDYYPSPGTWDAASDEHADRIKAVSGVMDDICDWANQVQNL